MTGDSMFESLFKDRTEYWMSGFFMGLAVFVLLVLLFCLIPFFMILDHQTRNKELNICKTATDVARCVNGSYSIIG